MWEFLYVSCILYHGVQLLESMLVVETCMVSNIKEGVLLFSVSSVVVPKFPAAHPTCRVPERESEFISHIPNIQGVPGGMCQTSGECSFC